MPNFPESMVYDGDMAGRPPTKDAPPFGERMAAARKARGLSQEALASKLATTRANIAYYERKAGNPTLEFIQRCAEVLAVSVSELMGEAAPAAKRPGPASRLEKQVEQIRRLSRSDQQFVSKFLDQVLSKTGS